MRPGRPEEGEIGPLLGRYLHGLEGAKIRDGRTMVPMAEAPALIVVNEAAGGAHSQRTRRSVELARSALAADVHASEWRDPGVFQAWLRERIDGYATLIVAGGDGSLGMAYTVAAERGGPTLGYIPAGVGNATAHTLRLPRDPAALAAVLAGGEARPVDLVAVNGRLALFAGAGLDARVVQRYTPAGSRRMAGWAWAVARSLPDLWRRPSVEVRADGWVVHRGPMEMLVVSTTPFYGRGLNINPGARPDAGRLTLRVYPGPAPIVAVEAVRWAAHRRPRAEALLASTVEVRSTDGTPLPVQAGGDLVGEREEWRFEVRPAAVRLIGRWS